MALMANINVTKKQTGNTARSAKPIDDGPEVTVEKDQKPGGLFSGLDELFSTAREGANSVLNSLVQREVRKIDNSEQVGSEDTTGIVEDQAGGTAGKGEGDAALSAQTFFQKNKTPILIGVAAVGLVGILLLMRK